MLRLAVVLGLVLYAPALAAGTRWVTTGEVTLGAAGFTVDGGVNDGAPSARCTSSSA